MMNLRNDLFVRFGYNKIFLHEVMNDDTRLVIMVDDKVSGVIFGEVQLTENGWEVSEINYQTFENVMKFMEENKETLMEFNKM